MTKAEKKEKNEMVERIAEKFILLSDSEKSFIAGYMVRAAEESGQKTEKAG